MTAWEYIDFLFGVVVAFWMLGGFVFVFGNGEE